jgi:glucose-1-phosphate thymidylyltransferase
MIEGSEIVEPVRIESGAVVRNSKVGPNVTIEAGARIDDSELRDSIVGEGTRIAGSGLRDSYIGARAVLHGVKGVLSVGDYTEIAGEG